MGKKTKKAKKRKRQNYPLQVRPESEVGILGRIHGEISKLFSELQMRQDIGHAVGQLANSGRPEYANLMTDIKLEISKLLDQRAKSGTVVKATDGGEKQTPAEPVDGGEAGEAGESVEVATEQLEGKSDEDSSAGVGTDPKV